MPAQKESALPRQIRVKSADRTLMIFEHFEASRLPATLGEIAQSLGFPVSSTLALLRSLQDSGYLVYDSSRKTYFPSLRLATLGSWLTESAFHNAALLRIIDELVQETGETLFLGIQNGLYAQYIHVVQAEHVLRYHPPVGTKRPLLRSAIGRVLVSALPDAQATRLIQKISSRGEDAGRSFDVAQVLEDLRQIREDGFAFSANTITAGAGVVAVLVPPAPGRPNMAIGVGGPSERIYASRLKLRDTIRKALPSLAD